jgi:hypothetical protein
MWVRLAFSYGLTEDAHRRSQASGNLARGRLKTLRPDFSRASDFVDDAKGG